MASTARPPRCMPRRWRTQAASHWHCAPPCSSSRPTQCYLTDQIEEAIAARLSALGILQELDDWRPEGHVLRWLSRLHWFLGRNDKADRYANAAVAMLDGLPPGCEMAWALSNRATAHAGQRRRRSRRMGHASHRAGDPSRRFRGAGPCAEQRRH